MPKWLKCIQNQTIGRRSTIIIRAHAENDGRIKKLCGPYQFRKRVNYRFGYKRQVVHFKVRVFILRHRSLINTSLFKSIIFVRIYRSGFRFYTTYRKINPIIWRRRTDRQDCRCTKKSFFVSQSGMRVQKHSRIKDTGQSTISTNLGFIPINHEFDTFTD